VCQSCYGFNHALNSLIYIFVINLEIIQLNVELKLLSLGSFLFNHHVGSMNSIDRLHKSFGSIFSGLNYRSKLHIKRLLFHIGFI
jgi:hypothetical protein